MEVKQYKAAIEAILFASGDPVSISRLADVLDVDAETAARFADDLANEINLRDGGIRMLRMDEQYQLCTRKEYADQVRQALDMRRNAPLSQAAMEVLAIVAYNQPVTKAFVEQVRGVDCTAVLHGLLQKILVEEKGRLELPGRPLLYGTTSVFLRSFGVSKLSELPPLPEQEDGARMVEPTLEEMIENAEQTENLSNEE